MLRTRLQIEGDEVRIPLVVAERLSLANQELLLHLLKEVQEKAKAVGAEQRSQKLREGVDEDDLEELIHIHSEFCGPMDDYYDDDDVIIGMLCCNCHFTVLYKDGAVDGDTLEYDPIALLLGDDEEQA